MKIFPVMKLTQKAFKTFEIAEDNPVSCKGHRFLRGGASLKGLLVAQKKVCFYLNVELSGKHCGDLEFSSIFFP